MTAGFLATAIRAVLKRAIFANFIPELAPISTGGAEFIATNVRAWIGAVGAKTAFIAPGSPWENGYCESFNARFRDEMLNGEVFTTLREAQILIER